MSVAVLIASETIEPSLRYRILGWCVRKGKVDTARNILSRTYKGVPGFDLETEIGILEATVEIQKVYDLQVKQEGPLAIFKGLNLKRFLIGSYPKVRPGTSGF